MIVRFDKAALLKNQQNKDSAIGVEGDSADAGGKVSEADKIVNSTRQMIADGGAQPVGVSASNSGRGHDPVAVDDADASFKPTTINGPVEEEPSSIEDSDAPEVDTNAIPKPESVVTPTSSSPTTAEPDTKS